MRRKRWLTAIWAILCCAAVLAGPVQAGSLVSWGSNTGGLQDDVPEGVDFIAVSAGASHSLALKADGGIVGWGSNTYGEINPPDSNDFTAIAAGVDYSLALREDGSIFAWGTNDDRIVSNKPAAAGFKAIAAGSFHALAIAADGSVVGWGANFNGQSSDQNYNDFFAIAAGNWHSIGIRGDGTTGTLRHWGYTASGLGAVPSGSDFVAVAAGDYHSLALRSNGTIEAWGISSFDVGQISGTPQDGGYIAIAAKGFLSMALKDDGSIVAWGINASSQAVPPAGNNYITIAAGTSHGLAVSQPGSLTLTSPNGGEILKTGTIETITWETGGTVSNVVIEYSADNGATWNPVAPQNEGNTGAYDWLVPILTSEECLVKITSAQTGYIMDQSDAVLTVYTCTLTGDVTGDCIVDLADLAVICSQWLECAYPFVREPLIGGDVNGDDKVDVEDLMVLSGYYLGSTCRACDWCGGADIDKSGSVNIVDMAQLAKHWMMTAEQ